MVRFGQRKSVGKLFQSPYDYAVQAIDYDLAVPVNRLTVKAAAESLGVTPRRVNALIQSGRLKSERLGNMHLIKPADLEKVRDRKPGRPANAVRPPKGKRG